VTKKIFVLTDLEGVAGVASFRDQTFPEGKYYEAAKRLLTAEVNAAVAGMVAAGVEDVLVFDAHGPGGIVFEELHPAAQLLHGRPLAPWERIQPVVAEYDAAMVIGQHAMAGVTTGNLNHTQNSRAVDYYRLNGRPIGETAQFALFAGALGVPVIFLSGDEAACREAEELNPGIVTVAVKRGLGRESAISLSAAEARRRIREGVERALARHRADPLPPLRWPGPYELEMRFFATTDADARAAQPGAERVDGQTVRFRSDRILDLIYR
jgi:D-amino peptidase